MTLSGYKPKLFGHPAQIKKAAETINTAERPVIIAGRGVIISKAFTELRELAEKAQIPVITTLLCIGCFPETHVLSFGWLGMHGMAYANQAVYNSDVIVAIGMRFDDRATGMVSSFAPQARVVHIDIDPAEIGKNVRVDVPIVGDVKNVLEALNQQIVPREHLDWFNQVDKWRDEHPALVIRECESLLPQYVIRQIYEITEGNAIVVTGVGQNQMWSAQFFFYDKPNSLISSGGLGTMGFELPGAIGAKVGQPNETVWCIAGDGGFQMNIQELITAVANKVPVTFIVINNSFLGMVRQWQELFHAEKYSFTDLGSSNPDFVKIGAALGIPSWSTDKIDEVDTLLEKVLDINDGPSLLEFKVVKEEMVFPMVPSGGSISDMILERLNPKRMV